MGYYLTGYTFTKQKLYEYFQIQARLLWSAIGQLPLYVFGLEIFDKFSYMQKRKVDTEMIITNSDVANGNRHRWWNLIAQKSSLTTI